MEGKRGWTKKEEEAALVVSAAGCLEGEGTDFLMLFKVKGQGGTCYSPSVLREHLCIFPMHRIGIITRVYKAFLLCHV